jgi:hypothetical protein
MKTGCFALLLSVSIGAAYGQAPSALAPLPQVPVPVVAGSIPQTPISVVGGVTSPSGTAAPAHAPDVLPPPEALPGPANAARPFVPLAPGDVPPAPPGDYLVPDTGFRRAWVVDGDGSSRLWLQADFLLWFIKDGPLNVPLVTTGSTSDTNPGALGQPHTQVLYGNSGLDYGAIPGGRFEMGYWFDSESRFGIEGGFFLLSQKNIGYSAFSNDSGSPVISVPFYNAQTHQEDQISAAFPGSYAGGVVVNSSSVLGGADLNGCFNLVRSNGFHADLLAGFRFVDLREYLSLQTPDVSIGGAAAQASGTAYNTVDYFHTSNQFYGGQLGGRFGYRWDRLSVDFNASVALGSTYQSINIDGYGVATAPGGSPQFSPGGIFAQPTNMGRYWAWDFAVVPEGELKFAYRVWRNVQVSFGYDFLYWSSVVRPGPQLNRDVNLSQNTLLGGTGTLAGPAQPVAPLTRGDFFAQGLTVGLEFHW